MGSSRSRPWPSNGAGTFERFDADGADQGDSQVFVTMGETRWFCALLRRSHSPEVSLRYRRGQLRNSPVMPFCK